MRSEILPDDTTETPDLIDIKAVCRMLGGSRPVNPATVYRQVTAGTFPRPIKISPSSSRWFRSEIMAAIAERAAARDATGTGR